MKKENFKLLVNGICKDMKSDIIEYIRNDNFEYVAIAIVMLESLTKMFRNPQGDEDEVDLNELKEVYLPEFYFIACYLFSGAGELTWFGEDIKDIIGNNDDYQTVCEFFKSMFLTAKRSKGLST